MGTEVMKLILGIGESLVGRLMLYDSLRMNFKDVKVRRNPDCELCGDNPSITELVDYVTFCDVQLPGAQHAIDEAAFEISGTELKSVLDAGRPIQLLDVREPHEWQITHIDSAQLTPLSQFDGFIDNFNPEDEIYLYCYKGKRSMTALKKMHERGFTNLKSLTGGIDTWALEVDTSMPRY